MGIYIFKSLRNAADLFFFQFYDLRGREVLNRKRVSILAEMYSNPMCGANGLSTHWLRNCFGPHWS